MRFNLANSINPNKVLQFLFIFVAALQIVISLLAFYYWYVGQNPSPAQSAQVNPTNQTASTNPNNNLPVVPEPLNTSPIATPNPAPQTAPTPVPTPQPAPVPAPQPIDCNSLEFNSGLVCFINNYRVQNGLNSLTVNASMANAAINHSAWMSNNGNLTHTQEVGSSNEKFTQRCINASTVCDAENLAWASPTISASQAFNMWVNSAGHNANMLGSHLQIGVANVGNYVTAVFN